MHVFRARVVARTQRTQVCPALGYRQRDATQPKNATHKHGR